MSPPKLQFAFQGGGAKFIAMLPVAAAISKFAKKPKIEIAAVAGTSAGAICAALIAADCDFDRLVDYLRRDGDSHIDAVVGNLPDFSPLSNVETWNWMTLWRLRNVIIGIAPRISDWVSRGRPVLNATAFEKFIYKIFETCRANVETDIASFRAPKLFITATDLVGQESLTLETGPLKPAVIHSCSIPVALRSFEYLPKSRLVDGGLCNNLPVSCLLADQRTPIFAVFPVETTEAAPIRDLFSYFLSAIFTPMEDAVKRAKLLVSEEYHIPVRVGFSTFEFKPALEYLRDETKYKDAFDNTTKRLENFVNLYGNIFEKTQIRFTDTRIIDDYMSALYNITTRYEQTFKPVSGSIIVRVNCEEQFDHNAPDDRPYDTITIKVSLQVITEQFSYYRTHCKLDKNLKKIPLVWWARNHTRDDIDIPIRALSLDGGQDGARTKSYCLIEFLNARDNIAVGDILELTCVYNMKDAMTNLNKRQADYVTIENPHSSEFAEIEIITVLHRNLGKFRIEAKNPASPTSRIARIDAETFSPSAGLMDQNYTALGLRAKCLPAGKIAHTDILPLTEQVDGS